MADQDTRALQEELRKLRQDLTTTRQKIDEQSKHQLSYPLDKDTASVLKKNLEVQLTDALWELMARRYMQYSSAFEYVNLTGDDGETGAPVPDGYGWFVLDPSPAGFSSSYRGVNILTGAVATNFNELYKGISSTGVEIYYYNRARLRFIFSWNTAPLQPSTMYLTLGRIDEGQYWGFKVVTTGAGAEVYGVAYSTETPGGEKTVLLYTDVDGSIGFVRGEAVLVPGLGINFYLSTGFNPDDPLNTDFTGKPFPLGRGILKNPIPPNTPKGVATDTLFYLYVRTDAADIAGLQVSFCEYTTELQYAL